MDTQQLIPEPLEQYCQLFDQAFTRPTQQATFRTYLQGLLLGTERHKTATGLANTEPGQPGSRHKDAQRLQWFLSESTWDPEMLNEARLAMLRTLASTAPCDGAVLVIDETGDRKYGTHTAHVGRQYLGSLGKVDSGIVTVHVLYSTALQAVLSALEAALKELEHAMATLVADVAPALLTLRGMAWCWPVPFLLRLVTSSGLRTPITSRVTAARPRSNGAVGKNTRWCVNVSGNRQLNRVLHLMALTRLRCEQRTKTFVAKKEQEGPYKTGGPPGA